MAQAAVSTSYLSQVDVDSALSLLAIHLSTVDFVRLRFLAGGHSKLLEAERFLRSDILSGEYDNCSAKCYNRSEIVRCPTIITHTGK